MSPELYARFDFGWGLTPDNYTFTHILHDTLADTVGIVAQLSTSEAILKNKW